MEKVNNPFCCRESFAEKKFTETEYIHYMEVEKVAEGFDPQHPELFTVEKESVEYERIPIHDYINSFASKVGLKNELKGIVSQQQMDDFVSSHKATPGFTDLTKLPDTEFGMSQLAAKLDETWDSIPDELKGSLTKEEFMKTLTSQKIKDYLISQLPKEEDKKDGE